ncbi:MAG: HNH endonuclease, partial [Actinomycetota bacterium]
VNFWRPKSTSQFRALEPGGLFLFKLHSPNDFIVGGGFFLKHSVLPLSLAWDAFELKNGAPNIDELRQRIWSIRGDRHFDPEIGSTVLVSPFFWDSNDWIPVPTNWNRSIMRGKTYSTDEPIGKDLWTKVHERLESTFWFNEEIKEAIEEPARYGKEFLTKVRLGQGSFRVMVTEAYAKRCSVTGERTLPVLQAAHIKPFSMDGPHNVKNGILLRSDLHILFDGGYITVTPNRQVIVSRSIKEEFKNGRDY